MAIAADVSSAQLMQQKQTTTQLLDATEKTVNGLNRTLSHDEEEIVNQIRSYVAQSRKATGTAISSGLTTSLPKPTCFPTPWSRSRP